MITDQKGNKDFIIKFSEELSKQKGRYILSDEEMESLAYVAVEETIGDMDDNVMYDLNNYTSTFYCCDSVMRTDDGEMKFFKNGEEIKDFDFQEFLGEMYSDI